MENLTFAAILVMTDVKQKQPDFKRWLTEAISKAKTKDKFCSNNCFFKSKGVDPEKFPCKHVKIFNAAHLPGIYDYILEMLCPSIGVLELFVNQCLRAESDIAEVIKDTYTYVGVPVGKRELPIYSKEFGDEIEGSEPPPWKD